MRLYEFDSSLNNNLMLILRNLTGRADSKIAPQTLTYPALNAMLSNTGQSLHLDQDTMTQLYDNNPELSSLIIDFDDTKITLGTKVSDDQKTSTANVDLGQMTGGKTVDQMAHSEVQDHYKKISR